MSTVSVIHCYPPGVQRFFGPALNAELGERTYVTPADHDELIAMLPDIEVLFGFRMDVDDWGVATSLRMIQSTGAGVDWLLPAHGLANDVAICNAKGAHEPHMPEFAMAMLGRGLLEQQIGGNVIDIVVVRPDFDGNGIVRDTPDVGIGLHGHPPIQHRAHV